MSDGLSDEIGDRIADLYFDAEKRSFESDESKHEEALGSESFIPEELSYAGPPSSIFSNASTSNKGDETSLQTRFSPKSQESFDPRSDFFDGRYDGRLAHRKRIVERYLHLQGGNTPKERISNINAFRLVPETGGYQQIFHFSQRSKGSLIDSPPIIHSFKDLIVWPNGIGELIFGDLNNRSYFAAKCSSASQDKCLISVQGKFSPCGQYLHVASLSGFLCSRFSGNKTDKVDDNNIHCYLHVTTYRLSKTSPLRTPPRLVHCCMIKLHRGLKVQGRGPTRRSLGYTLTWLEDYLYVTTNDYILRIARLPLFQWVERREPTWRTTKGICENDGTVFLPESSADRDLYFFPFPIISHKKQKPKHNKQATMAMLFLSSNRKDNPTAWPGCNLDDVTVTNSRPSQIVFLKASQLGNWVPVAKEAFWPTDQEAMPDSVGYLTSSEMLEKCEFLEFCTCCGSCDDMDAFTGT